MANPTGINQYTKRGAGGVKNLTIGNIRKRAEANKKAVSAALSRANAARKPSAGVIAQVRQDRAKQLLANRAESRRKASK